VSLPSLYRSRARKLTAEQESAIHALAETRSLRTVAADFGVSHETIRAVLRQERRALAEVP
jgi:transposase